MKFNPSPEAYQPKDDHLRVATASPEVAVGDVATNVERIEALYQEAVDNKTSLVVFPELSLTGYSIQDAVLQDDILSASRLGLDYLADRTAEGNAAMIVGAPLAVDDAIYNTAAVLADGEIKAIIPKQHMPNYTQFYEKRWYSTWDDRPNTTVSIEGRPVPFGRQLLVDVADVPIGVELCEDLWVSQPPHQELAAAGALVIANPSASPEDAGKAPYRRNLVAMAAAKSITGYAYVSADASESTADTVMSGHAMINENGTMLAERRPFATNTSRLSIADIDISHLRYDRRKDTNFISTRSHDVTPTAITRQQDDLLTSIDATPFIPKGSSEQIAERLDTILDIQAHGLAGRLRHLPDKRVVLGLSGGLDSTLALLVAVRTANILDIPTSDMIHTLTMPSRASSQRTQSNAVTLAHSLGIPNEEIPIAGLAKDQLDAIQHTGGQDITFENTQARIRQALVFNKANQIGGLALGTGDLTETMIGWCTYGGDQTSGYHVNASVPKTLVRSLVAHAAHGLPPDAHAIVDDIVATPISPELVGDGTAIDQKTEDLIGPVDLLDFFTYHTLRWKEPPRKIGYLALKAFDGTYDEATVTKWLNNFTRRFYQNQWKRQAMPDGPRVGLSASPRGDLRLPPDISSGLIANGML